MGNSARNKRVQLKKRIYYSPLPLRLFLLLTNVAAFAQKSPNFIIIQSEGLNLDDITSESPNFGGKLLSAWQAPTPWLDKLTAEGTFMTRAYSAAPKCAPSRFAILAGRYASKAVSARTSIAKKYPGVAMPPYLLNVPTEGTDLSQNVQTALKNNGWMTGTTGKFHLLPRTPDTFSELQDAIKANGFDYADGVYSANLGDNYNQTMEWCTDKALTFINQAVTAEKPFFLHYNPVVPNAPLSLEDLQNDPANNIITPAGVLNLTTPKWMKSRSDVLSRAAAAPGVTDKSKLRYAAMVWLDDAVGALYQELAALQQLDNTVIVFTTDHAAIAKGDAYELGSRVPFIVRGPSIPKNVKYDGLVSTVDIAPTFLALAGNFTPSFPVDGENFAPKLTGTDKRTHIYLEVAYDRAVVTENFKYMIKPQGDFSNNVQLGGSTDGTVDKKCSKCLAYPGYLDWEQMYDLANDEAEQVNIVSNAAYSGQLALLKSYMACLGTPASIPLSVLTASNASNTHTWNLPACGAPVAPTAPTAVPTVPPPTVAGPPTKGGGGGGGKTPTPVSTGGTGSYGNIINREKFDGPALWQPPLVVGDGASQISPLKVTLEVDVYRHTGYINFTTRAFHYKGTANLVGPTLVMRQGQTATVTLVNKLTGSASTSHHHVMNTMDNANTTNIHTHGLHTGPNVDSIFVAVEPGASHTYAYDISAHHAPGVHWYHSHFHGASTLQVMGGLVGAIFVEPAASATPVLPGDLATAPRLLMVLNHLKFNTTGDPDGNKDTEFQFETYSYFATQTLTKGTLDPQPEYTSPANNDITTVNGQYQPFVTMVPGDINIFEIVNAASGGHMYELYIKTDVGAGTDACDWWILSMDGVYFDAPRKTTRIAVVQAGRMGIAVQCSTAGTYYFQSDGTTGTKPEAMPKEQHFSQNLVTLKVAGTAVTKTMPTALNVPKPAYLQSLLSASPDSKWEITVDNEGVGGNQFQLGAGPSCPLPCGGVGTGANGQTCNDPELTMEQCRKMMFDGQQGDPLQPGWKGFYPHVGKVGQVEELVINGRTGGHHPIHIHVNHFQIVKYEPTKSDIMPAWFQVGDWRDVVPALPGRLTVRWPNADISGEIVFHCHILRHEDTGMMDTYYIAPKDADITKIPHIFPCDPEELAKEMAGEPEKMTDMTAIASKGFAWFTGSLEQDVWMPTGKTAVFFGFQQFRYVNSGAISPDDARNVGQPAMSSLTEVQKTKMCDMVEATKAEYEEIHKLRAKIVSYLHDIKNGRSSSHAASDTTSTKDSIIKASTELYKYDGKVALMYAKAFASLELTTDQVQYWNELYTGAKNVTFDKKAKFCSTSYASANVNTVASELFAWYIGNEAWTQYIAEGKIANVFGFMNLRQEGRQPGGVTGDRGKMAALFEGAMTKQGCSNLKTLVDESLDLQHQYQVAHFTLAKELFKLRYPATATKFNQSVVEEAAKSIGNLDGILAFVQANFYKSASTQHFAKSFDEVVAEWTALRYPLGKPDPNFFTFAKCPALTVAQTTGVTASVTSTTPAAPCTTAGAFTPGTVCTLTCSSSNKPALGDRYVCYEFEGASKWTTYSTTPDCISTRPPTTATPTMVVPQPTVAPPTTIIQPTAPTAPTATTVTAPTTGVVSHASELTAPLLVRFLLMLAAYGFLSV